MTTKHDTKDPIHDLRRRAESALTKTAGTSPNLPVSCPADVRELVHSLEVHQIELKLQNEELQRAHLEVEKSRDRYVELYDLAPVGYVTLNREGCITEANLTAARLLGMNRRDLIGQYFSRSLDKQDSDDFSLYFRTLLESKDKLAHNLQLIRTDGTVISIQLDGIGVQDDNGEVSQVRIVATDITERKKADRELNIMEAVIKTSITGIGFAHPDGNVFYVNDAFARIWGLRKPADAIGLHASELAGDAEAFSAVFAEFREVGHYSGELKAKRQDGRTFDVELSASTVFDDAGNALVFMASFIDISDRKKAEQDLRFSAERLREHARMLEEAPILVKDMDDRIVYWNEGTARLYGFTKSQAVGQIARELLRTEFSEPQNTLLDRLIEKDKWQGELRHKTADGETIVVASLWVLVRNAAGKPARIIETNNDITDLKKAEQALRESEELSHAVFESTGDAMYIKDRSLRFQHVNSAMCRLIGLPAEAIIGRKAEDIFGQERGRLVNEREARVLSGECIDVEHALSQQDSHLIFHDVVVPLKNLAGNIVGVYCILRNITDRKTFVGKEVPKDLFYPSPAMQNTLREARYAAKSDGIVLLQGESGSGKDFLARWIHDQSSRSSGPFFTVNCAAVPTELAESELFGHERGAFTGAQGRKRGMMELAEGGTILLNEIGELDLTIQSKLLAFLDSHSFVRVGGQKQVHVNARLIAASHRDLREEVEEKRFLEPLYYRINVFPIRVPPLRERREDLPALVKQFISRLGTEMQLTGLPVINESVLRVLRDYPWPGNVRELRNVLERSLMLWTGGPFEVNLSGFEQATQGWSRLVNQVQQQSLQEVVEEVAHSLCEHTLLVTGGNKKETARRLGISRDTLYRYLKKMERTRRKHPPHHVS